jgi:hypothetical protein
MGGLGVRRRVLGGGVGGARGGKGARGVGVKEVGSLEVGVWEFKSFGVSAVAEAMADR